MERSGKDKLTLRKRIEAEIKSYDGCMGLYIDDLKGHVISLNETEQYETASTIKVFILAALFDEIEKGNASLDSMLEYKKEFAIDGSGVLSAMETGTRLSVKNLATLMIIVSDNIATNILIDYLGIDTINACIQALGCKDTVLHNPLDFEKYEKLGTTTPKDYGSLFVRMAKGTLISREASEQMLEICKMQHLNTMLTKYIPPYYLDPDNYDEQLISIASKSGSMDACRNDGGIFLTPFGDYVIVILNKDFADAMYYPEHPALVYGAKVSKLIFDQYMALEGSLEK